MSSIVVYLYPSSFNIATAVWTFIIYTGYLHKVLLYICIHLTPILPQPFGLSIFILVICVRYCCISVSILLQYCHSHLDFHYLYWLSVSSIVVYLYPSSSNIGTAIWTFINYTGYLHKVCLLYTSPSPRDLSTSRMPSSA